MYRIVVHLNHCVSIQMLREISCINTGILDYKGIFSLAKIHFTAQDGLKTNRNYVYDENRKESRKQHIYLP